MSKLEQLRAICKRVNKQAAKENPESEKVAFLAGEELDLLSFGVIRTGNPAIDTALGGGMPKGTIVQISGVEGAGKSRACFDMIAHNQKVAREKGDEFVSAYVYLEERAFPVDAMIAAGVDLDSVLVINVNSSAEKTFDILMRYLWDWDKRHPLNILDLVVIDSIAAAVPEAELKSAEESLAGITIGRHASLMSKTLRVLSGSGALGKCLLVLINQWRTDINSYGGGQISTGGKALGYYPKISIEVRKPAKGRLKRGSGDNEETYGHTVVGVVSKNNTNLGKPYATFSYQVVYGEGVDLVLPTIDAAIRKGIINHPNNVTYTCQYNGGLKTFRGRTALEEEVKSDTALYTFLQESIIGKIAEKTADGVPAFSVVSIEDLNPLSQVQGSRTDPEVDNEIVDTPIEGEELCVA